MSRHSSSRPANATAGQEIVEFALVVPLLLLLIFGVVDLARVFYVAITLTNASREGARYAMMKPSDTPGIEAAVRAEALNSGVDLTTSPIGVSCPSGCGKGLPVRVTVTHTLPLIMTSFFSSATVPVIGRADMLVP